MLKKTYLTGLAGAALGLLAGCGSTPLPPDTGCGVAGGVCRELSAPASRAPAVPEANPKAAPAPASEVITRPVELLPSADGSAPVPGALLARVALLLPLESTALAEPADALRAGFMAAASQDTAASEPQLAIDVVSTGDAPDAVLDAYRSAAERNDIIVGPLARSAVTALAASGAVSKPTIALSHPQSATPLPPNLLVIGILLEDDAHKVADWAASEHPGGRALILTGQAAWQQRLSGAFAARWSQLGRAHETVELPVADGYVDGNALAQLRSRLQADPPQLMFAALDAGQLSQVRMALGTSLPTYGTATVNPGSDPARVPAELGGVRLLDVPWTVQPSHAAVVQYPRFNHPSNALDLQRLYALGIDAYRITRELARDPRASFSFDGATGRLTIRMDGSSAPFTRIEAPVVVRHAVQRVAEPAPRADGSDEPAEPVPAVAEEAVFDPVITRPGF